MTTIRTYSDLRSMSTLEERFDYLQLGGRVGDTTFGMERWVNQQFYRSREWRQTRDAIIVRDGGLDLGTPDRQIAGSPHIHHINPLTLDDIEDGNDCLFDPENLISASQLTHNAIHFGDRNLLPREFVERSPGDTRLW